MCVHIACVYILHHLHVYGNKLENGNTFLCVYIVIILILPIYIFLYTNALNFSSISVDYKYIIPLDTFILDLFIFLIYINRNKTFYIFSAVVDIVHS